VADRNGHLVVSDERHVDLFKVEPLSAAEPRFLRRLALDDPMMRKHDGSPTQLAEGWATGRGSKSYTALSAPSASTRGVH
jgi:hypothetical protein